MVYGVRSFPRGRTVQARSPMRSNGGGAMMAEIFPTIVYLLCFLTSLACAWLLGRSYYRVRTRFLLWSSISFAFLAANDLALALAAVLSLIWGFVWEVEEE